MDGLNFSRFSVLQCKLPSGSFFMDSFCIEKAFSSCLEPLNEENSTKRNVGYFQRRLDPGCCTYNRGFYLQIWFIECDFSANNINPNECSKLAVTMAHQFPNQLLDRGVNGQRVYNSVMENASSKVVFRLSHEENLRVMAQWLFMGVMNPDLIKHQLYSTKVMAYREELKEVTGESWSSGGSHGRQRGRAAGEGMGGTWNFYDGEETLSTSASLSEFSSESESESDSWSESSTQSRSLVPTLVPVFGKELSHVQFRSIEEQLFRAMAVLFDQKQRQCVARIVGMNAPISLYTPTVTKMPGSPERTRRYLEHCYSKLPFALSGPAAKKQLYDRAANFKDELFKEVLDTKVPMKRRIR